MKTFRLIAGAIMLMLFAYSTLFAMERTVTMPADTAIHPGKDKISKDLLHLRDSINITLSKIGQKSSNSTTSYRKVLTKADNELILRRTELEKVLDEVMISTERTWDENLRIRAIQAIRDGRRDYYRIMDDIKQAMSSGSSR